MMEHWKSGDMAACVFEEGARYASALTRQRVATRIGGWRAAASRSGCSVDEYCDTGLCPTEA